MLEVVEVTPTQKQGICGKDLVREILLLVHFVYVNISLGERYVQRGRRHVEHVGY